MANTKNSKKPKKKRAEIVVTNLADIKPAYSNYAQISHTPHEFVLNFCYIDQAKIIKGEEAQVIAEAFSRIVVSPSFLPSIIEALEINLKKYNKGMEKEIEKANKGAKK